MGVDRVRARARRRGRRPRSGRSGSRRRQLRLVQARFRQARKREAHAGEAGAGHRARLIACYIQGMLAAAMESEVLASNDAFYDAFNMRDIDAMDKLWAERAPVVCLHPGSTALHGRT